MTLRMIFAAAMLFALSSFADARQAGCPSRWCGCYMRTQVFSDPGPAFNLARNWLRWGSPTSPTPGAIVVWRHHVGRLVSQVSGNIWIVHSGNDGRAVRERPRSIAGALGFRS